MGTDASKAALQEKLRQVDAGQVGAVTEPAGAGAHVPEGRVAPDRLAARPGAAPAR